MSRRLTARYDAPADTQIAPRPGDPFQLIEQRKGNRIRRWPDPRDHPAHFALQVIERHREMAQVVQARPAQNGRPHVGDGFAPQTKIPFARQQRAVNEKGQV